MNNFYSLKKIFFVLILGILLSLSFVSSAGFVSNTTKYLLHNESDSQFSTYKQIKNSTADVSSVFELVALSSNGNTYCGNTKWIAPNNSLVTQINGTWDFNVYANCSKALSVNQYFIFSKIFIVNSSGEYNFANTTQLGVICNTTNKLKNWSYSLASSTYTNFSSDTQFGVQICARIAGGSPANTWNFFEGTTSSNIIVPVQIYDTISPDLIINNPLNRTYNTTQILINFSAVDNFNVSSLWYYNGSANVSYTSSNTLNLSDGVYNFIFYVNDSVGNLNSTSLIFTVNATPVLNGITALPNLIAGGNTITINSSVTSATNDTLQFLCSETFSSPVLANSICTGGNTLQGAPYNLTCSYATVQDNTNHTVYCRVYDTDSGFYSSVKNSTYTTQSITLTTNLTSVAGDTVASYFDTVNDGKTNITISGESGMTCRWSSSDLAYSAMSNMCSVVGIQANCSINDIASQGFYTRYVSCANSLGIGQTASNNLDVSFYLDYSPPNTSVDSDSNVHAPNYVVNFTESDLVDTDPTTYYCKDTTNTCTPTLSIDNGGQISFTSSNRGVNYLRFYSVDDANNTQTIQSKTININQLPVFNSAIDNSSTIKGGSLVNITTIVNDSDGQILTLYVCSSSGATSSGCAGTQYCTASATSNLSCLITSETDSATHTWYAYIFDSLGESATANPLTGSYTTDSTPPVITLISPLNNSNNSVNSITFEIVVNEPLGSATYSINSSDNVSLTNISLYNYFNTNSSIPNGNYYVEFYAKDSYGNLASYGKVYFIVDNTLTDVDAPSLTIVGPSNNSYNTDGSVLLNVSSNENLSWAGYSLNGTSIADLGNISLTLWNVTLSLGEGIYNTIIYANDSSSNKNQGNSSVIFYVDLTNPAINSLDCPNKNDSDNVSCSLNTTDNIGLNYVVFSYNSTGVWQNSSQISLSGISSTYIYTIFANETSPSNFSVIAYVYDLSGRISTSQENISISDNTPPRVESISYIPNNSLQLDPGVSVNVTANITDDYNLLTAFLMYKQISDSSWNFVQMNNYSTIYNATFVPTNGSWEFKINATDSYGNVNLSTAINLTVENDTTQNISLTIPSVKSIIYLSRTENNSLGNLIVNNTGDNPLNIVISLNSSSIQNRLGLNTSGVQIETYSLNSNDEINLSIYVNSSELTSGLYNYNLTVSSEAGTTVYEKQLNIQTSDGPYLVVSVETYSAMITRGQTGIELSSSVTNLGTQDSLGTFLNWTLPSGFSVSSGSLSRNIGSLPIGASATNSLIVSVLSSATDTNTNLTATATSSNADSKSSSKLITIGSPQTTTETVIIQGTSGGGGGGLTGGGGKELVYSKQIEVVRGEGETFEIEVNNKNSNSYLKDITINLGGFLASYIEISPDKIDYIGPNSSGYFKIKLKAPPYKESYEEYDLKAIIAGNLTDTNKISIQSYKEIQNIKLIIQQISRNESENSLSEAEKAISEMNAKGFNTLELEKLLSNAKEKLSEKRNYDSKLISDQIIQQKDTAFQANDLILNTFSALLNPKKLYLITGNAVDGEFSSQNVQNAGSVEEVLNLAKVAFERGDYNLALERAQLARYLLLLERKGNIVVFVSIYWPFILLAFAFITFGSYVGVVQHRRVSVTNKIKELNKKEIIIKKKLSENQREYFNGKRSHNRYVESLAQSEVSLSNLRKQRITLRNKRIKILKPEKISEELKFEIRQIESEIKKLQEEFYNKKTISEGQYKIEFAILNERLGEIEKEKTTLELINKNEKG